MWSRRFVDYMSRKYDRETGPASVLNDYIYKSASSYLLSMKHGRLQRTCVLVDMQPSQNGCSRQVQVLDLADHPHAAVGKWSANACTEAKARRLAALRSQARLKPGGCRLKMLIVQACLFVCIFASVCMLGHKVSTVWLQP